MWNIIVLASKYWEFYSISFYSGNHVKNCTLLQYKKVLKCNLWIYFHMICIYYVPPALEAWWGGHQDLLWFPVTQMWVGFRPSTSVPDLCIYNIAYSFLPMALKFSDMVIMDKTLDWLTFRDYGSIFKVTGVIMFQN